MGNKNDNIGFIGAGKMATAIIKGVIDSGFVSAESVFVHDVNKDAMKYAQKNLKITPVESLEELMKTCPVVVIATKPFVINELLDAIKEKIRNHLVVSICAGVSTSKMEAKLGKTRVIRVMPNTPALINEGMTAVCKGQFAYKEDVKYVLEMFSKVGRVIEANEKDMDIITAISGSGPSFYYMFIEKIARAGAQLGLNYKTALELSTQTALGAAKMIFKSADTPEELIRNVTTPGGCTEVGNNILVNSKIDEILFKTVKRTAEKAKKLGG